MPALRCRNFNAFPTLPLLPLLSLPLPCREQREREAELREFDELLRRREAFKQKGPPYS